MYVNPTTACITFGFYSQLHRCFFHSQRTYCLTFILALVMMCCVVNSQSARGENCMQTFLRELPSCKEGKKILFQNGVIFWCWVRVGISLEILRVTILGPLLLTLHLGTGASPLTSPQQENWSAPLMNSSTFIFSPSVLFSTVRVQISKLTLFQHYPFLWWLLIILRGACEFIAQANQPHLLPQLHCPTFYLMEFKQGKIWIG